jgi:hypothetical protein
MIRKVLAALTLAGVGMILSAPVAAQPAQAAPEAAAPSAAQAELPTKVRPGYWSYSTKVSIFGGGSETKCLKAAEIEKFLFNPCNHHHVCTYPVRQVGNGRLHLEGEWVEKKKGGRIPVTADGTYTPTTLKMTAHVKVLGGLSVSGQIDGKWLSDTCPVGTK